MTPKCNAGPQYFAVGRVFLMTANGSTGKLIGKGGRPGANRATDRR